MSLNEELNNLKSAVAEHKGKVDEFIINTVGYRKDLCSKLDRIMTNLTQLPCSERKGWYTSMNKQIGFMWVVLGFILAAIIGVGIKGVFDNNASVRSLTILKEGMVAEAAQCVKQELYNQRNDNAKNN